MALAKQIPSVSPPVAPIVFWINGASEYRMQFREHFDVEQSFERQVTGSDSGQTNAGQ